MSKQVNEEAEEGVEQGRQHGAASMGAPELPVKPPDGRLLKRQRQTGGACPTTMGRAVGDLSPVVQVPRPAGRAIKCTVRMPGAGEQQA